MKDYFSNDCILLAWERYIRCNQKEAKDYLGIKAFGSNLEENINRLSTKLLNNTFKPSRPPKFFRPKPNGMQRTITILPVEDALVYQAVANSIASNNYESLTKNNAFIFGSVLNEEVKEGITLLNNEDAEFYFFKHYLSLYKEFTNKVNESIELGLKFVLETDITGFFDSIPHYNLLSVLSDEYKAEKNVLDLIGDCLNIWSGTNDGLTPGVGIPQSTEASAFFANIILHNLDNILIETALPYFRYMDDIRIFGDTQEELRELLREIDNYLKRNALALNSKKTLIEEIKITNKDESYINFDFDSVDEIYDENKTGNEFLELIEQEGYSGTEILINKENFKEEIDNLFQELEIVKDEFIKTLKLSKKIKANLGKKDIQRKFTSFSYEFRRIFKILKINEIEKNIDLEKDKVLEGLIYLLDECYWNANQYCWTIELYNDVEYVKTELLKLADKYSSYEWVQHQIYRCLAISQVFSAYELRQIVKKLDLTASWFAKKPIYMLLLKNCKNEQMKESILHKLINENDFTLKRSVLDFSKLWSEKGISNKDLLIALGIEI
jgi:hypothetical protein